jgi:hypothetical protein
MKRFPSLIMVAAFAASSLVTTSAFADTTTSTSTTTTTVESSTTTTTSPSTTTTVKPVYVDPLTGKADPSRLTKHRSALTIKIDNTPQARPQYGIDKADVVYEEIVEGGITRLAAIFNSQLPTKVGPVRSVRRTDREIVYPVGGIFGFSGGAQYAIESIVTAPVKLYDQSSAGSAMFRDPKRYAPHNLYANAQALMTMGGGKPKPPPALFTYQPGPPQALGPKVRSFVVGFASGYATSYSWDDKTTSWDRSIFGYPDVTADGVHLAPKNVIVMSVHYKGGVGVEGSQAVLTGSGLAQVFTDGTVQRAKWSRTSLRKPIVYKNLYGQVIALTPGQTWVELLDVSEHTTVTTAK